MINEQAVVEAFAKIKEEFLNLRKEIKDLKERVENIENGFSCEEVGSEKKKIEIGEEELADSYY
ncbi:hypothetical protein J4405_03335 [Candidatus Woesearchaeota archaeon]|nr:hypothetical protein [Candidatus Woesearchaeota archaeon]